MSCFNIKIGNSNRWVIAGSFRVSLFIDSGAHKICALGTFMIDLFNKAVIGGNLAFGMG